MKIKCKQVDKYVVVVIVIVDDDDDNDDNITPVRRGEFDLQLPNSPPGCQGRPFYNKDKS